MEDLTEIVVLLSADDRRVLEKRLRRENEARAFRPWTLEELVRSIVRMEAAAERGRLP